MILSRVVRTYYFNSSSTAFNEENFRLSRVVSRAHYFVTPTGTLQCLYYSDSSYSPLLYSLQVIAQQTGQSSQDPLLQQQLLCSVIRYRYCNSNAD
jgi:hypothetical protein